MKKQINVRLDFSALDLYRIGCDRCGKQLCYGFDDGEISGHLCSGCYKIRWLHDAPDRIKWLRKQLRQKKEQLACANSEDGHDFKEGTLSFITAGPSYTCQKCGYFKSGFPDFQMLGKMIEIPKLEMRGLEEEK